VERACCVARACAEIAGGIVVLTDELRHRNAVRGPGWEGVRQPLVKTIGAV
jgi:hypothetical protein